MEHRKPTILLVEDQPTVRLMLHAGLSARGFDVLMAGTGEKALALCKGVDGPIDLLITDIGLTRPQCWTPDADAMVHGIALADAALTVRPSLKVLLLTGHSDEIVEKLDNGRPVQFPLVRKPCDLSTLVATVRQLLGLHPAKAHSLTEDQSNVAHTAS